MWVCETSDLVDFCGFVYMYRSVNELSLDRMLGRQRF